MFILGSSDLFYGTVSTNWPTTPGTIIESSVSYGAKAQPYSVIKYTYQVHKQTCSGSRIRFGDYVRQPAGDADTYSLARPVSVFYNPTDPRQSVLEPGAPVFTAGLACLLGIAAIVAGLMYSRKTKTSG